jgi:tetratricopeptide (TPR) repeat protein
MGDAAMPRLARVRALILLAGLVLVASACVSTPVPDGDEQSPMETAEARRNIGIDHIVNGRIPFGIRELRHALSVYEPDPLTHLWLGQAYLLRDKRDDAIVHSERALELDPSSHEARIQLSTLYIMAGRYGDAVAQADILVDDPTFSSPWRALTNRGWAQLKLRQLDLARESLEEALEYSSNYWPAILNLGILEQIQGDHIASLRYFQEVQELAPGPGPEAESHYRMAEAYVSLGHRERAVHHLEQAIELSPHGRWGRQSREYLALLN